MLLDAGFKLNLYLRITSLLKDGYHSLYSLFCRCLNGDKLIIKQIEDQKDILSHKGPINLHFSPEDNLIIKFLKRLRKEELFKDLPRLKIELYKFVPPQTGLGGGSADVACVARVIDGLMRGFCEKGDYCVLRNRLLNIVSEIGSDIPFFLSCDSLAFVEGKGEIVLPVKDNTLLDLKQRKLYFIVLIPPFRIETKKAYMLLDKLTSKKFVSLCVAKKEARDILSCIFRGEQIGLAPNDFVCVLKSLYPTETDYILNFFKCIKTPFYGLSGSGSAFWGLYYNSDSYNFALNKAFTNTAFKDFTFILSSLNF